MWALVLAVGVFGALVWAGVLWWALRGRQVGEEPVCAGCGFDLRGTLGTSERCSECGANLAKERAVATGRRLARRRWSWVSGMGIAASLAVGVAAGMSRGNDLSPHLPTWALRWNVTLFPGTARDAAVAELRARRITKAMGPEGWGGLVEAALERQATASHWDPAWGRIVESARRTGDVDDATWERYLVGGIGRLTIGVPAKLVGGRLNLLPVGGESRYGDATPSLQVRQSVSFLFATGAWSEPTVIGSGGTTLNSPTWGQPELKIRMPEAVLRRLDDGPWEARFDSELGVDDGWVSQMTRGGTPVRAWRSATTRVSVVRSTGSGVRTPTTDERAAWEGLSIPAGLSNDGSAMRLNLWIPKLPSKTSMQVRVQSGTWRGMILTDVKGGTVLSGEVVQPMTWVMPTGASATIEMWTPEERDVPVEREVFAAPVLVIGPVPIEQGRAPTTRPYLIQADWSNRRRRW